MARKKNLERAIILGLILSTGVYGSAWAAEVTTGDFENAANVHIEGISVDENNYTVSKDNISNNNNSVQNTDKPNKPNPIQIDILDYGNSLEEAGAEIKNSDTNVSEEADSNNADVKKE